MLVPIKAFTEAKRRLERELDPTQRATLARAMASRVLAAARPFPTSVVCDDEEVALFAEQHGAKVIYCPERGLNPAVAEGVRRLGEDGFTEVIVSHSDLPYATGFDQLEAWHGVTLVPDRHMRGTNVAVVPTKAGFDWSYGPGSLGRHRSEALRLGLPLRIMRVETLGWDVDLPADLLEGPAAMVPADLVATTIK